MVFRCECKYKFTDNIIVNVEGDEGYSRYVKIEEYDILI